MILTFERLIDNAMTSLDRAGGDVDSDFSGRLTQQSIAYSMIAIAQELHRMNEHRANKVEQRLDLSEARLERWRDEAEDNFAE